MAGGTGNKNAKLFFRRADGSLVNVGEIAKNKRSAILANQERARQLENMKRNESPGKQFRDTINNATTKSELLQAMRARYGKGVQPSFVNNNNLKMIKRVMTTWSELEDKYPAVMDAIGKFKMARAQGVSARVSSTYTLYGLEDMEFQLGKGFWSSEDHPSLFSDKARGFHPPNQNPESTVAHEFAHVIQSLLTDRLFKNANNNRERYELLGKLNKGTTLDYLERRALDRLGIKFPNDARYQISQYAQEAKSFGSTPIDESFSEAFSDVFANGKKASRVSKAYVAVLLEELNNGG